MASQFCCDFNGRLDLRRVVAAMKLSSNLERMADQATDCATRAEIESASAVAGSRIDEAAL
jgi:phosphate uptake regulator